MCLEETYVATIRVLILNDEAFSSISDYSVMMTDDLHSVFLTIPYILA